MPKIIHIKYDPASIESKWQSKWETEGNYQPDLDSAKVSSSLNSKPNKLGLKTKKLSSTYAELGTNDAKQGMPFYNLMMFPYPSAEGLHVGSIFTFGGIDVYGRFQRMRGYQVFEPIGLDGFGIHSENHAIKTGSHPIEHAKRTEENFYRQLHAVGNSYAWKNKLETYDPNYYRWTQWLFVQLFKSGLAYKKNSPVNFCPSCKTVLSDEQVIDGKCERCGSIVEKRDLDQWFFRITHYAERLLANIEKLDWSERVKLAQKNWIGKKEGINITYQIENFHKTVTIFTTRPDTNFGATFIALAPEHSLITAIINGEITVDVQLRKGIQAYVEKTKNKSEIERLAEGKEKTGAFTGLYSINPLTSYKMPIWVSDFVLGGFGTGALVGVPGHDKRDFEFAKKFDLEVVRVVVGKDGDKSPITEIEQVQEDEGTMINSGFLDGMDIHKATEKMMDHIEAKGYGKREVTYHLRDWLISRQRYWGPPIPMIHCEACAKRKPKILVIHGIAGDSNDNWFPWFQKQMEERGYYVIVPSLPNPDNPTLKEWTTELKKLGITKKDKLSIVAHSLGGPTAIEFIRQSKLPVKKLVLVAPVAKEISDTQWDNIRNAGYESAKETLQLFSKANEKLEEVAPFIEKSVVYLSDNDPYIPMTVVTSFEALHPNIHHFTKHGHFNIGAGIVELPKILDEFRPVVLDNIGWMPVPEENLPVKLPYIKDFKPLGTGKAPLANYPTFYKTTCPKCGGKATRETDVSDTFLDSSWYFLRYLSTDWDDQPFPSVAFAEEEKEKAKNEKDIAHWEKRKVQSVRRSMYLPVTSYIGGAEHSVLHLLYARFITMALKDMGYVDFEEPFARFYAHGLIIKDGAKMSKSKGNIINPDDYIHKYGADTLRTYLLFLGPFHQGGDFRDSGIDGMSRFLKRVWKLLSENEKLEKTVTSQERLRKMHEAVKGVTEDMEHLRFNTAIAKLMTYYNFLAKEASLSREEVEVYLKLFAPFAPHMTEELWAQLGNAFSIHTSNWPKYDEKYLVQETATVAVQVNGKLRGTITIDIKDKENKALVEKLAREDEGVKKFFTGEVRLVISIPGKIINFVV